jgi:hypothetical protein
VVEERAVRRDIKPWPCRPRPCSADTHGGRRGPGGASLLRESHIGTRDPLGRGGGGGPPRRPRHEEVARDGRDVARVHGVQHRLGLGAACAAARHGGVRDEVWLRRDHGL